MAGDVSQKSLYEHIRLINIYQSLQGMGPLNQLSNTKWPASFEIIYTSVSPKVLIRLNLYIYEYICNNNNQNQVITLRGSREHGNGWREVRKGGVVYFYILIKMFNNNKQATHTYTQWATSRSSGYWTCTGILFFLLFLSLYIQESGVVVFAFFVVVEACLSQNWPHL